MTGTSRPQQVWAQGPTGPGPQSPVVLRQG